MPEPAIMPRKHRRACALIFRTSRVMPSYRGQLKQRLKVAHFDICINFAHNSAELTRVLATVVLLEGGRFWSCPAPARILNNKAHLALGSRRGITVYVLDTENMNLHTMNKFDTHTQWKGKRNDTHRRENSTRETRHVLRVHPHEPAEQSQSCSCNPEVGVSHTLRDYRLQSPQHRPRFYDKAASFVGEKLQHTIERFRASGPV